MADLASLVIGLRADVAQLQSDLGKANALNAQYARAAAEAWNGAAGAVKGAIVDIAGKVAAAFAVDKLIEFGRAAIDTADELGKMSQRVGVSVETLSSLRVQAQLSNVSIDDLQGGLSKLARNAADAAAGSKQQANAFQAIGVAVKDANGNLRPTADILADISKKFAGYADSGQKAADAQQFFGKSGAELIPLLNQLGSEGFAAARKEAESYGAVLTGDAAKASEEFNDNLTKLHLETQGFANAVTQQLLPGLNQLTGQMVEAGKTTENYGNSATIVANVIKGLVLGLVAVKETIASATTILQAWFEAIYTVFTSAADVVNTFAQAAAQALKGAFTLDPQALAAASKTLTSGFSAIGDKLRIAFSGIKEEVQSGLGGSWDNVKKTFDDLFGTFANVASGAETTAKAIGNGKAPLIANADAADKAAKALEAYNKAQQSAAAFLAQLQGNIDPVTKAYEDYVSAILQANKISDELIARGKDAGKAEEAYAQAVKFSSQAIAAANKVLDEHLAKLAEQGDVLSRVQKDFADQAALIGLTDREKFIAEAVQKATEEWNKNTEAGIKNKQTLDELKAGTEAAAAGVFDLTERAKEQREVAQQWASIWTSAGQSVADTFAKVVVEGGSLLKGLADIAKQVVEQIIAYFARLAIINPILNAIFGGSAGFSLLPTLAGAAGGSVAGTGLSLVNGQSGSSSSGGLFDTASNGYSLFTAGQKMWDGFSTGLGNFWYGTHGTVDYSTGLGVNLPGQGSAGYNGSFGGYGSGWGQALGIAGGVYAGYNRYQNSAGGAAGVAGGLAYGVGTYAAGAGLASAAAGTGFAAGVSGAFAAVPVIGWIALAAMLVDMVSGGKLFGTKGTVQGGSTALNIDATGADYTNGVSLKGQKALFGGAKWSWQDIPETPEQKQAAQAFFDSMTKTMANYADQFGVKAGDLVSATFEQKFDKKGNPTGETTSTIAGYTYQNLTSQQFAQAYVSANELTVLDQFDSKLEDTIKTFRATADGLNQIAAGLTNVEGYLQAGGDFLAIAGKDTLSSVVTLAEGMQAAGETIDQTMARLIQAQQKYDQFVQQFKAPTKYVDDFEATLSQINKQMLANIKTANDLAKAAGAEGASEKDLANIHDYAARQMAAAIQQLEASAQSLAFSLGLTTKGSLDDVNQEIARLQAKAGEGSHSVRSFGDAMQSAAQKATDAMNLLLGDLSPLNDQEKLQKALQGLRAGTVTQEQVLQIGRRLYASSQAYTDLFNMVQQMGGHVTGAGAPGVSGGAGGGGGLTGAERQRLSDLLKEQQQLQAAAQLQQYQTLAQQIAEISSAKGEDWRQVVTDMGIDIKAFEKGLGLSDQQTNDLITNIQSQKDDNNENTASIIDAINNMSDAIVTALGGTPSPHDDGTAGTPSGGRPAGHGGHARPPTAQEIGDSVGRSIGNIIFQPGPRNLRPQTVRVR